ncbi:MAG: hypothetical protein U5L09_19370 [Bacteroidales bacterium]|nr:hypothetical protein [Bacteroidales bacterium]
MSMLSAQYDGPEKTEAMLWLGRTFTQLEYYDRAASRLDQLKKLFVTTKRRSTVIRGRTCH